MRAKNFGHFMAFWQQLNQVKNQRPTPSHRRVARAKATLRSALVNR